MAQTVIGIFDNQSEAQNAVEQLVDNGFSRSSIDVSAQDASTTTDTTETKRDNDDSISGFFKSLFSSDDDVDRYSTVANRGSVITVHAQSAQEAERAADILDEYGAVDVNERAAQYGYGNTDNRYADTTTARAADLDTNDTNSLKVIEEEMQVGKRVVETGGARLRSRIVERPVEEHVRLRTEHVHVERNPVNRPATEADFTSFKEGTIEVTEHAEMPVVGKQARVIEEVNLSKEVEEREEVIRDKVRHTEVDVENIQADETTLRTDDSTTRQSTDLDGDDLLNRPANR